MQTALRTFVIVALAVALALGLYLVVQSQFSMSFGIGGFSPGFSLLLKLRAAENGGQIAPSLDTLGASGALGSGMPAAFGGALGGALGGADPLSASGHGAALSKGIDLQAAPAKALTYLERLGIPLAIAALVEWLAYLVGSARRRKAAESH